MVPETFLVLKILYIDKDAIRKFNKCDLRQLYFGPLSLAFLYNSVEIKDLKYGLKVITK